MFRRAVQYRLLQLGTTPMGAVAMYVCFVWL